MFLRWQMHLAFILPLLLQKCVHSTLNLSQSKNISLGKQNPQAFKRGGLFAHFYITSVHGSVSCQGGNVKENSVFMRVGGLF